MSQTDPRPESTAKQQSGNMRPTGDAKKGAKAGSSRGPGSLLAIGLVALLLAAAGLTSWILRSSNSSPPSASASFPEDSGFEEGAEPDELESGEGPEVGAEPAAVSEPAPSAVPEKDIRRGTERRTERDVANANVDTGRRDTETDIVSPLADLNVAVAVKHKHRIGSCDGVLRASAEGMAYESEHKDAFTVALSDLERFDFEKTKLTLKVQGGRKYDFNERNDNEDALFGFHQRVGEALDALTSGDR